MQSSVKFRLNQRIQNLMSQLLIELLSTRAVKPSRMIKTLQIMVMDFVYLDLSRQISEFNISNSINQQFNPLPPTVHSNGHWKNSCEKLRKHLIEKL